MGRATSAIARIQAGVGLQTGGEPDIRDYSNQNMGIAADTGGGFGPGTAARRALILWLASAGVLFVTWRAVKGY